MSRTASRLGADAIDVPEAQDPVRRILDRQLPWATRGELFTVSFLSAGPVPDQGWKLHVSATPWSAPQVLERVLPEVLDAGVGCKVVNTRLHLMLLNNGVFGRVQAGKFITLYPADGEQAVRLALRLHDATVDLPGPRIATDRPLRPRSLVHYRYGAFRSPPRAHGAEQPRDAMPALRDPDGRLLADRRELFYVAPAAVADPFEEAGAYVAAIPRKPPLAGRYLVLGALAASATGGVYRALDLNSSPPRTCVLKEYWRDAGGDLEGRLAPTWGEAEADLLARHVGDDSFPEYVDRFELDGNLMVVLEYVEGRSLAAELEERRLRGAGFSAAEAVEIGAECARALAHLHALGIVYRDFSPGNVVLSESGGCRLIDFGLAHEQGFGGLPPRGLGTRDYCAPQQWNGDGPDSADDVYSWGAVMQRLAPELPAPIMAVVERALAAERADRYAAMTECALAFEAATRAAGGIPDVAERTNGSAALAAQQPPPTPPADPLALAREVGEALCESALERDGGVCWASGTGAGAICSPDLYNGAAGVGLFLAELGAVSGEPRYRDAAAAAARWIAGPVWAPGRAEAGLYCGEAGVGWFLLRLAELTENPAYVTAAELRARRLRGVHLDCLDLNAGAAGLLVFLVRLARVSEERRYREWADELAGQLRDGMRPAPGELPGACWPSPTRAASPLLGLAHGAAGIALALVEHATAAEDERSLDAARAVAELLLAERREHPEGGWCWRESLAGEAMRRQAQCHGAVGIGQFFLRLARLDPQPRYIEAAAAAARTAAQEIPQRTSVGICHGLAGDGHLLLECAAALGEETFRPDAEDCAARLQRFADPQRAGAYRSPETGAAPPDLLNGSAGAGSFYLRLAGAVPACDPVLA